MIAVAGLIFGEEAVHGEIVEQLGGLIGARRRDGGRRACCSASKPKRGIIAIVIGVVVLLLGATTVFAELQSALDRIWRAPARKDASGLWRLLRSRLLSFGMILGIAFLLMVSLVHRARRSRRSARCGAADAGVGRCCSGRSTSSVGFALTHRCSSR